MHKYCLQAEDYYEKVDGGSSVLRVGKEKGIVGYMQKTSVILIKKIHQLKEDNARQLRKNFRTKDGRKVALTGCSRSSETQAQWTDIRAAADREVSARMKTLTR